MFPRIELFVSVELYLGNGLEMSHKFVVTQVGETAWLLLTHIMVWKYMYLCATW